MKYFSIYFDIGNFPELHNLLKKTIKKSVETKTTDLYSKINELFVHSEWMGLYLYIEYKIANNKN